MMNTTKTITLAIALSMAVSSTITHAAQNTDFKMLFKQALETSGVVRAELSGPVLKKIQNQINSDARIFVEIQAIRALPQEGCKRLKVLFSAPDAKLPTSAGTTVPLEGLGFQLNLCPDMNPPVSSASKEK
jgi:hypothetical protein